MAKSPSKTPAAKSPVNGGQDRDGAVGETLVAPSGELHQQAGEPASQLTTNQGVPISDNQNSLKVGARGPVLLQDFILREKIMHFDHERIPERVVHARGSAAHGFFECLDGWLGHHLRRLPAAARRTHPGVHPLLDRGRQQGLGRPGPRRARLRRQVLHPGGQLRSRRQQHPGVLHPGRHQVPRPDPRRQAGARPRVPAGPDRPRHLLGLHLADAREHAHDHVDHVGPGHPALATA